MDVDDECVICLEPLDKFKITKLPCNHIMHKDCIIKLKRSDCILNNNCPICKYPIEYYNYNNNNNVSIILNFMYLLIQIIIVNIPVTIIINYFGS